MVKMDNNDLIIKIKNLTKSYKNGNTHLTVIRDVEFKLKKNQIVVITGVSGSGKTTFLNLLGGFDKPDTGSILINGVDITSLNEYEISFIRNKSIGYVFQAFYLIEELTVLENVILPALKMGVKKKEAIKKGLRLLDEVGIYLKKDYFPVEISGGEKQRVAIARAIINEPDVILADEPTGNLDKQNKKKVIDILLKMTNKKCKSLIIATHDEELGQFADIHYNIENKKLNLV